LADCLISNTVTNNFYLGSNQIMEKKGTLSY